MGWGRADSICSSYNTVGILIHLSVNPWKPSCLGMHPSSASSSSSPQTINWVVIIVSFFFFLGGYVIELSGRQFETGPETEQKMLISWKPLDKQGRDRGVSYWEAVGPAGWLDGSVMGAPSHQVKATVTVSAFLSSSTGHLSISQTEALERKCSFSCFPQVGGQGKLLLR